jgi:hypothetical protein
VSPSPLNVLNLHLLQDTGGQSIRIKQAFDRHAPGWVYNCAFQSGAGFGSYIQYPTDLRWAAGRLRQRWRQADVVHLHTDFRTARQIGYSGDHKPAVIHYHGTSFRHYAATRLREQLQRRAIGICSTLDLWLMAPEAIEWLPAPYNLGWLARLREQHRRPEDGQIRIAHAPTNRGVKSTEEFLAAVSRLQAEGYPVELELIERVSWDECLPRKAASDIYFDQVLLGYGNNAIEAWGMGIPVVAGAADATLDEMERRFGGLPFYHATPSTVYDALRELVEDESRRQKWAQIGAAHAARWHDEALIVRQLQGLYHAAIEAQGQAVA